MIVTSTVHHGEGTQNNPESFRLDSLTVELLFLCAHNDNKYSSVLFRHCHQWYVNEEDEQVGKNPHQSMSKDIIYVNIYYRSLSSLYIATQNNSMGGETATLPCSNFTLWFPVFTIFDKRPHNIHLKLKITLPSLVILCVNI